MPGTCTTNQPSSGALTPTTAQNTAPGRPRVPPLPGWRPIGKGVTTARTKKASIPEVTVPGRGRGQCLRVQRSSRLRRTGSYVTRGVVESVPPSCTDIARLPCGGAKRRHVVRQPACLASGAGGALLLSPPPPRADLVRVAVGANASEWGAARAQVAQNQQVSFKEGQLWTETRVRIPVLTVGGFWGDTIFLFYF